MNGKLRIILSIRRRAIFFPVNHWNFESKLIMRQCFEGLIHTEIFQRQTTTRSTRIFYAWPGRHPLLLLLLLFRQEPAIDEAGRDHIGCQSGDHNPAFVEYWWAAPPISGEYRPVTSPVGHVRAAACKYLQNCSAATKTTDKLHWKHCLHCEFQRNIARNRRNNSKFKWKRR